LIERAPAVQQAIELWRQIQLSEPEARILAEEAMSLRFEDQNMPITVEQVLRARRGEDSGNSLWQVFNVIQESLMRGGLRYRRPVLNAAGEQMTDYRNRPVTRSNSTREVKGIGQNVNLNKALWSLGEKMAELKSNQ